MSCSYGKLQNTSSLPVKALVNILTLSVTGKRPDRLALIDIYLPTPTAFAVVPGILNKPDHIPKRIAQE